jgi:hypothetical protein
VVLVPREHGRSNIQGTPACCAAVLLAASVGAKLWRGVLTVWRALKILFGRKLWGVTVVLMCMW